LRIDSVKKEAEMAEKDCDEILVSGVQYVLVRDTYSSIAVC